MNNIATTTQATLPHSASGGSAKASAAGLAAMACRVVVGGLFVVTALAKIDEPATFIKEIHNYGLAPYVVVNPMGLILPWVELFAGLLLALGIWRREAGGIVGAMLIVFTIAKAVVYAQGKNIECGCGGHIQVLKYLLGNPQGIATNIALFGMLTFSWLVDNKSRVAAAQSA